jgi:hypothetical protein
MDSACFLRPRITQRLIARTNHELLAHICTAVPPAASPARARCCCRCCCSHPDLKPNMHPLIGWNLLDGSNKPMDDLNHGTHVAGILGAAGNNSRHVAGVNWKVGRRRPRARLSAARLGGTGGTAEGACMRTARAFGVESSRGSRRWGPARAGTTCAQACMAAQPRPHLPCASPTLPCAFPTSHVPAPPPQQACLAAWLAGRRSRSWPAR